MNKFVLKPTINTFWEEKTWKDEDFLLIKSPRNLVIILRWKYANVSSSLAIKFIAKHEVS